MEYSTFNLNKFYIKKDSTLPILKYPLTQKILQMYDISDKMLENVAITFSMVDIKTNLYRIANVPANLIIIDDINKYHDEEKYTLTYKFKLSQTSKVGRYRGEFTVDFLSDEYGCGKIKLPVNDYIDIVISDSITKTTVI